MRVGSVLVRLSFLFGLLGPSKAPKPARPRARFFKPKLERLEDRVTPSATLTLAQVQIASNEGTSTSSGSTVATAHIAVGEIIQVTATDGNSSSPSHADGNPSLTITLPTGYTLVSTGTNPQSQTDATVLNAGATFVANWFVEAPSTADASAKTISVATTTNDSTVTDVNSPTAIQVQAAAAPAVTLTDPAAGLATNNTRPTIDGTASVGGGASTSVLVKIYSGSTLTGTPLQSFTTAVGSGGAYSAVTPTSLVSGSYTVQVSQGNSAGIVGTSAAHTFTVDTATAVAISSATNPVTSANVASAAISGTAEAGDSISLVVSDGTHTVTQTTTATGGNWSITGINISMLADGPISYTVTATNAAGNTAQAQFSATKDTLTIVAINTDTNPVTSANVTSAAVTGTAQGSDSISLVISDGTHTVTERTTATAGGSWSITGINLSSLSDGTISYTATATDAVGNTAQASANASKATSETWTDAGGDNLASNPANWSGHFVPGPLTVMVFDGTSGQNAIIDSNFGSTVGGVVVNNSYQGSLIVNTNLTVTGAFQNDGQVIVQNGTLTLQGGGQGAGTFDVGNGSTLLFAGGAYTPEEGAAVQGDGGMVIGGQPGQTGSVIVPAGVTLAAQPNTTLAPGGTIGGPGTYTIAGQFTWTGGSMTGTGVTQVANGGTLTLNGPANVPLTLNQRSLNVDAQGTVTVTAGTLTASNGAVITNNGTFNLTGNNVAISLTTGADLNVIAPGQFNVAANMQAVIGGDGSGWFSNQGEVAVGESGTLAINIPNWSDGGTYNTAPNALVQFNASSSADGITAFTGSGTIAIGAAMDFVGFIAATDSVTVVLSGGTLYGEGSLTMFGGTLNWQSGTISTEVAMSVGSTFNIGGQAPFGPYNLAGGVVDVYGTANLLGCDLNLNNLGNFNVMQGGVLTSWGESVIGGDGTGLFTNQGAVNVGKDAILTIDTQNQSQGGTYSTAIGSILDFNADGQLWAGTTFAGVGNVNIFSSMDLAEAPNAVLVGPTVNMFGMLTGDGSLVVFGTFIISDGSLQGSGQVVIQNGICSIDGLTNNGFTLINNGALGWIGGNIVMPTGTIINNTNLFGIVGDANIEMLSGNSTAGGAFKNNGTITIGTPAQAINPGTVTITCTFAQEGALALVVGTLVLPSSWTQPPSGILTITAGATLEVSGTFTNYGKVLVTGGEPAEMYTDLFDNYGILDFRGTRGNSLNLTSASGAVGTGNYRQEASGELDMQIDGLAAGQFSQFIIQGTATFAGNFRLIVNNNLPIPAQGTQWSMVLAAGGATGQVAVIVPNVNWFPGVLNQGLLVAYTAAN